MQALKKMLPYWVIVLIGFYVLPFAIKDTGMAMLVLLIAIPMICFVCALIYGIKNGFNIIFSIVMAILFIPSMAVFYNATAWVYVVAYFIISLVGNLIGRKFFHHNSLKTGL